MKVLSAILLGCRLVVVCGLTALAGGCGGGQEAGPADTAARTQTESDAKNAMQAASKQKTPEKPAAK